VLLYFGQLQPKANGNLVRHIPAWMPGAGFQTFGQKAAKLNRRIRDMPVEVVKADMVSTFSFSVPDGIVRLA
jgi:hypothetical protein